MATMVIALLTAISVTVDAQGCRPGLEAGIGLSTLPYFNGEREGAKRTTPSADLRITVCEGWPSLDLGYMSLQQQDPPPGSVRRLDLARVMATWPGSGRLGSRVRTAWSIGAGKMQAHITELLPCPDDYGLCHEYAPHDATALALAFGHDARWSISDHLRLGFGATGYLPVGCWKAEGFCPILELRVAAILAIQ